MDIKRMFSVLLFLVPSAASHAGSPPVGDPQILALVETEYISLEDFRNRLSLLEDALMNRQDTRAIFAGMYVVLTENAIQTIEDGVYDDPDWTEQLMVAFGNLYREAFLNFEMGRLDRVPEVWRVVFEANQADEITVFQHGLLGVHAHINRDLPFAIAQVTPPEEREARYADYLRTNAMVVNSTQDVEELVASMYAPALGEVDVALGDFDENLLERVVSAWRRRAWLNARLFDGSRPPWLQSFAAAYLDYSTARRAQVFARDFTNNKDAV